MRIEHSQLLNEFISFWFETSIDGVVRYETFIDFLNQEWYTCRAGEESPICLRGRLDSSVPEDAMVEMVKPMIEEAIVNKRI